MSRDDPPAVRERKARILATVGAGVFVVGIIVGLVVGAGPVALGFAIVMTVLFGGMTVHWWRSYFRSRQDDTTAR